MKREESLLKELNGLYEETKEGHVTWNVAVQTTEHNPEEEKPKETEDGITWTIDECYVAYDCTHKGKDLHLITYEMIKTAGEQVATTNFVFLPEEGMRYFNLHTLLPYSVTASAPLLACIHNLWELLLKTYREHPERVHLTVTEGTLVIED
jgi:hypothetical protein